MVSAFLGAIILQSGLYVCPGDPNICDQKIRVVTTQNKMTSIQVEYSGWCGSQGPYAYLCHGKTCEDLNVKFDVISSKQFKWKNKSYDYQCVMQKKNQ